MSQPLHTWLLDSLRAGLHNEAAPPPPVPPEQARQLAARHGLDAALHQPLAAADPQRAAPFADVYQQRLLHGCRQLEIARTILHQLEQAHCPTLAMRGPFAALHLHRDIAARRFADLDLYIQRRHADRAWHTFRRAGWHLAHPDMPRGFYLRNHLHWKFLQPQTGATVDLHWRLDHPLAPQLLDYTTLFDHAETITQHHLSWRQPLPHLHLLVLALHLVKHQPDALHLIRQPDATERAIASGSLRLWLDIAALLHREAHRIDLQALHQHHLTHPALAAALEGTAHLFQTPIPESLRPTLAAVPTPAPSAAATPASPLLRSLAHHGDFSPRRLHTWRHLVFPQNQPPQPRQALRLTRAGIDALTCLAVARSRAFFRRRRAHPTTQEQSYA